MLNAGFATADSSRIKQVIIDRNILYGNLHKEVSCLTAIRSRRPVRLPGNRLARGYAALCDRGMTNLRSFHVLFALTLILVTCVSAGAQSFLTFVGPYTNTSSKGIYAYRFDASTGELTSLGLAAETPNPTFLAFHPNRKFLYAANEINNFEGRAEGSVAAFAIDASTGKLAVLNRVGT